MGRRRRRDKNMERRRREMLILNKQTKVVPAVQRGEGQTGLEEEPCCSLESEVCRLGWKTGDTGSVSGLQS